MEESLYDRLNPVGLTSPCLAALMIKMPLSKGWSFRDTFALALVGYVLVPVDSFPPILPEDLVRQLSILSLCVSVRGCSMSGVMLYLSSASSDLRNRYQFASKSVYSCRRPPLSVDLFLTAQKG
jgi:hypothetical protein